MKPAQPPSISAVITCFYDEGPPPEPLKKRLLPVEPKPTERRDRPRGAPYTVRDAAEYLSVSERTIWDLIRRGVLRSSKVVRQRLIPAKDVEGLVEKTV